MEQEEFFNKPFFEEKFEKIVSLSLLGDCSLIKR
jgi:hypothetical protein